MLSVMVLHGSSWFFMVLHGSSWFFMVLHGIWRRFLPHFPCQDGEVEWMLVSDNKPILSNACCETGGVWLGVGRIAVEWIETTSLGEFLGEFPRNLR